MEIYLTTAAVMLDCSTEDLDEVLVSYLRKIDEKCKTCGGRFHSRQAIAAAIQAWYDKGYVEK